MAAECKNARGANMVVLGCLAKVIPGMISGVKPFEFALDEAIYEKKKKFNPINIATIEAAFNKDYEIKHVYPFLTMNLLPYFHQSLH